LVAKLPVTHCVDRLDVEEDGGEHGQHEAVKR
jgi:hypothetical protein